MKNKAGQLITGHLNHYFLKSKLNKIAKLCSTHSILRSDEELRNSFDSFLFENHGRLVDSAIEPSSDDSKSLEEVLSILNEIGTQLLVKDRQTEDIEISQADSGNRLYASLKRHPE